MNEHTLIIRHVGTDPDQFEVMRLTDGKRTRPVEIQPPDQYPVEGRPNSNLATDPRWYLEEHVQRLKKRSDPNANRLCPQCGSPMILRTAKSGKGDGQQFWGCSTYPKCRVTQNLQ